MSVTLLFLGKLADLAGSPERKVEAPLDWMSLSESLNGPLGDMVDGDKVRIAVNGEVLVDKSALAALDGDEVALLPPVSGG